MAEEIRRIIARIDGGLLVGAPSLRAASAIVEQALSDAESLHVGGGPARAVDRLHTALHGYMRAACEEAGIDLPRNPKFDVCWQRLRDHHPALQIGSDSASGTRQLLDVITKILDAVNWIRNHSSGAYPTEPLNDLDATLVVNLTHSVFAYLDRLLNPEPQESAPVGEEVPKPKYDNAPL
ncbi:MAG: hypothetical protein ACXW10_08880 [Acidimicrobiia bacterium]